MGKHDCLPEEREDFNIFCKMILTQDFIVWKQMEVFNGCWWAPWLPPSFLLSHQGLVVWRSKRTWAEGIWTVSASRCPP